MVLGCYYLTKERIGGKGEGKAFCGPEEVRVAYDSKEVEEHARIKVRIQGDEDGSLFLQLKPGQMLVYPNDEG